MVLTIRKMCDIIDVFPAVVRFGDMCRVGVSEI